MNSKPSNIVSNKENTFHNITTPSNTHFCTLPKLVADTPDMQAGNTLPAGYEVKQEKKINNSPLIRSSPATMKRKLGIREILPDLLQDGSSSEDEFTFRKPRNKKLYINPSFLTELLQKEKIAFPSSDNNTHKEQLSTQKSMLSAQQSFPPSSSLRSTAAAFPFSSKSMSDLRVSPISSSAVSITPCKSSFKRPRSHSH
jgi:hypothetical protein